MAKFNYETIEFLTENGQKVCVEVDAVNKGGTVNTGGHTQNRVAEITFEESIGMLSPIANAVVRAIDNMQKKPEEIQVEFHIELTSEFNIKLLKLGSEANMNIKMTWKSEKDER